ncbi:hypothetical protein AB0M95_31740 [Sphaerisporangium sp. NPDC051017]|uniref:hypothetical protein n=1 Tax=Sphaerisporangium sp. NPDC051017 TaxID=3154636 RepID=UPI0034341231
MTTEQRLRRERVRMQAADRFADGATDAQVAREFRVSWMSPTGGGGPCRPAGVKH